MTNTLQNVDYEQEWRGRQCKGKEKQDTLTLGKEKMSVVSSGYNNSINNKLVGKQEGIYVCVQTTGCTKIW